MSTEECSKEQFTEKMSRDQRHYILRSILSKIKAESSYTSMDDNSIHQKSVRTVSTILDQSLGDGDENSWNF